MKHNSVSITVWCFLIFGDVFWWQGLRSLRRRMSCSHLGLQHIHS